MELAPPSDWPAIAIRDRSINADPVHAGRGPVNSSRTNETSAARPSVIARQPSGPRSTSQARQPVTRPSGKVVATLSYVCSTPATT
ncbi:hypothetical protein [Micromonospora zhanjiangensis]